jgi:hypothetical protein
VTVLQLQPAGGDLNRDNYGNFFQYFFSKQRVAVVPNIRPPVKGMLSLAEIIQGTRK